MPKNNIIDAIENYKKGEFMEHEEDKKEENSLEAKAEGKSEAKEFDAKLAYDEMKSQMAKFQEEKDQLNQRLEKIEEVINALAEEDVKDETKEDNGMMEKQENKLEEKKPEEAKYSKELSALEAKVDNLTTLIAQFANQGIKKTSFSSSGDTQRSEAELNLAKYLNR